MKSDYKKEYQRFSRVYDMDKIKDREDLEFKLNKWLNRGHKKTRPPTQEELDFISRKIGIGTPERAKVLGKKEYRQMKITEERRVSEKRVYAKKVSKFKREERYHNERTGKFFNVYRNVVNGQFTSKPYARKKKK